MTKKEIVQAILEKAIKNGWDLKDDSLSICSNDIHGTAIFDSRLYDGGEHIDLEKEYYVFIYRRDFAQAFFGERECIGNITCEGNHEYEWQHQLQKMVLKEDPIQYLAMFI